MAGEMYDGNKRLRGCFGGFWQMMYTLVDGVHADVARTNVRSRATAARAIPGAVDEQ